MADQNELNSALAQVQQDQESPGLVGTVGNALSGVGSYVGNFFNPEVYPEAAQQQKISQAAAQAGLDPAALQMQLLKQQQAPQSQPMPASATPVAQIQDSSLQEKDFVPQAAQPKVSAQTSAPSYNPSSAVDASIAREQQANQAVADSQRLKAVADNAYLEQHGEELKRRQAKMDEQSSIIQEKTNEQVQKLESLRAETENFKFKDFWADKSTGSKVMAGIAMALGGLGGAYTGKGDNKAFDVLNQAMERDLNLQKLNFEKMQKGGEVTKSILSTMNQQFDNAVQADLATRYYMTQAAQNELSRIASKYQGPELQARATQLNENLERQRIGIKQQFEQQAQMKAVQSQFGAGGPMSAEQEMAFARMDPKGYEVYKDRKERTVGDLGLARTNQGAKKANDILGAESRMVGNIQEMQKILKASPASSKAVFFGKALTPEAKQLQSLYGDFQAAYKEYGTLGTLDKGVEALVGRILQDPTNIVNASDYNTTIKMLKRNTKKSIGPLMENMPDHEAQKKSLNFKAK